MRWTRLIVLLLAVCLISTVVLPEMRLAGAMPDLFLLCAIYGGLRARRDRAILMGWSAGLLKDLYSADPMGTHALLLLFVAFALTQIRHYFFHRRISVLVLLTTASAMVHGALYLTGMFVTHPQTFNRETFLLLIWLSVYTGLAAPPVIALLARMGRWLGTEPGLRFGPTA